MRVADQLLAKPETDTLNLQQITDQPPVIPQFHTILQRLHDNTQTSSVKTDCCSH